MLKVATFNFRKMLIKNAIEEIQTKVGNDYFFNAVLIKIPLDMTDYSFINMLSFQKSEFEKFVIFCKSLGMKVMIDTRFSTPFGFERRVFTKYIEEKIKLFVKLGITDFFCDTSSDVNSEKNYNLLLSYVTKHFPEVMIFNSIRNDSLIFVENSQCLNKKEQYSMLFFHVGKLDLTASEIQLKYGNDKCKIYLLHTMYYGIIKYYVVIGNKTDTNYIVKRKHVDQNQLMYFPNAEQIDVEKNKFMLFSLEI